MKKILAGVMASTLTLGACTTQNGGPSNETVGTVIGGVAGGFLGSQFGEGSGKTIAAIGGTLLGAWVGSQVAQNLTAKDRMHHRSAAQTAQTAPVGETITWYNPQSGHGGTITPTREGQASTGEYCREFQQTVTIDGRTERAYGTACQQPDGSWRIVN